MGRLADPDSLPDHSRSFLVDARCRFEPAGGLQRKSTVYGLNAKEHTFLVEPGTRYCSQAVTTCQP
jgi:hypothetical protein